MKNDTLLHQLLEDVAVARNRYVSYVGKLTEEQANIKPTPNVWSAVENTEHLYWAEHGAIWGMWRAFHAKQAGKPIWEGELVHKGLAIEDIVARTWQPKETVPAIAAPRMGGSLTFWMSALLSLQQPLHDLGQALADQNWEMLIHPHPISGPLNARQRLEFIRFHIDRHLNQVQSLDLL